MQIGPARFSIQALTLTFPDGRQESLSPAQGAVLMMLANERGRVVSRPSLVGALKRIGVADSQLDVEIRTIGKLIGHDWSRLLEVVGDQGFLLHTRIRTGPSMFGRPLGEMSRPLFVGLLGLIALALCMVLFAMPNKIAPPFDKVELLTLASGNQIELRRFGKLNKPVRQLKAALAECHQSHWQTLSVAAPKSEHLLHLVVQGGTLTSAANIKFIAAEDLPLSLSLTQLQEAGLCD